MRHEEKKGGSEFSGFSGIHRVSRGLVLVLLAIVSFGVGVYYGENKPHDDDDEDQPMAEQKAMATIEDYLKTHDTSFHFQKVLEGDNPDQKQYLYTLHDTSANKEETASLTRVSPGRAVAKTEPEKAAGTEEIPPREPQIEPQARAKAATDLYVVQVESFEQESRAKKKETLLKNKGFPTVIEVRPDNALPYRLSAGPYGSKEEAQTHLAELRILTRPDAFIVKYHPQPRLATQASPPPSPIQNAGALDPIGEIITGD